MKQAIADNKKASFKYYFLDYKKNKVYRKDGKRYVVNPLVVVWNKDNYYLVCYYDNHDDIVTYRIDRMEEAEEEKTERIYRKEFEGFDIEQYRQSVFSMFGGEEQEVDLQFDSAMLDDVFDKFGEEVNIVKVEDTTYRLKVPIQVSKTFFAWVVGTQGKMKILAPQTVCDQFKEFVTKIKEEY